MTSLRTAALEALENHRQAEAEAARAAAQKQAKDGVDRVANSPLGEWFPGVQWEFVAHLHNGTTLVREKDGVNFVFGVRIVKDGSRDQGPDEWAVAVYQTTFPNQWIVVESLKTAADVGEYIERNEPKEAPQP